MKFGIDFGTTRTGVAVQEAGNYPIVTFQGAEGRALEWYPSVVAVKGEERRYGIDALACEMRPGWSSLRSFKRLLSRPDAAMTAPIMVGHEMVPLLDLMTGFLQALRKDLSQRANLPIPLDEDTPVEVNVAVPAHAHSTQRLMTLEAFRRAGFIVSGMMNEPSAAGVEFAKRHQNALTKKRTRIAVYDLGGGTFDASVVDLGAEFHEVVASAGISQLGGDDFDSVLMSLALDAAGLDPRQLSSASRLRLMMHCRAQKEGLNPNSHKVLVEIGPHLDQVDRTIAALPADATVTLWTKDFYSGCQHLVDRTLEVTQRVVEEGGGDDDLAAVYVVGGASALPIVGRALRNAFGRRVRRSPYPAASTAMGLAMGFADDRTTVRERLARSFGVFREARDGMEVAFDPIFDGRTKVPEAETERFEEIRTYRPVHNIGHFRYVECGWLDNQGSPDGDITPFADLLIPFDPALRNRKPDELAQQPIERYEGSDGPLIEERYSVDGHGVIDVTITDVESGYQTRHRMKRGEEPASIVVEKPAPVVEEEPEPVVEEEPAPVVESTAPIVAKKKAKTKASRRQGRRRGA